MRLGLRLTLWQNGNKRAGSQTEHEPALGQGEDQPAANQVDDRRAGTSAGDQTESFAAVSLPEDVPALSHEEYLPGTTSCRFIPRSSPRAARPGAPRRSGPPRAAGGTPPLASRRKSGPPGAEPEMAPPPSKLACGLPRMRPRASTLGTVPGMAPLASKRTCGLPGTRPRDQTGQKRCRRRARQAAAGRRAAGSLEARPSAAASKAGRSGGRRRACGHPDRGPRRARPALGPAWRGVAAWAAAATWQRGAGQAWQQTIGRLGISRLWQPGPGVREAADPGARTLALVTAMPVILLVAWLVPGLVLLLVHAFLPAPMVLISVPLAVALTILVARELPGRWPAPDAADTTDTADAGAQGASAKNRGKPWSAWWGLFGTVAVAAVFAVWQLMENSPQFIVSRDPGAFAQFAYWIADHGSLPIPTSAAAFGGAHPGLTFASFGFATHGGSVVPGLAPGLPIVLAAGMWIAWRIRRHRVEPADRRACDTRRGRAHRSPGRAPVGSGRCAAAGNHRAGDLHEPVRVQRHAGPGAALRWLVPGGGLVLVAAPDHAGQPRWAGTRPHGAGGRQFPAVGPADDRRRRGPAGRPQAAGHPPGRRLAGRGRLWPGRGHRARRSGAEHHDTIVRNYWNPRRGTRGSDRSRRDHRIGRPGAPAGAQDAGRVAAALAARGRRGAGGRWPGSGWRSAPTCRRSTGPPALTSPRCSGWRACPSTLGGCTPRTACTG